jgi:hypothetical protein
MDNTADKLPEYTGEDIKMPTGYRILLWILLLDIFALTGCVWVMAYNAVMKIQMGVWFPLDEFGLLMFGYHVLLFFISLIGFGMQTVWKNTNTLVLYPLAMILGVLALNMGAFQLAILLFSHQH